MGKKNDKAPAPAAKPSWWDDKRDGAWDDNLAGGYAAFQDVLGREISPSAAEVAGIKNWANYYKDKGYAGTTAQLSLSQEARVRGVNPADYGNTAVDMASLSGKDKEWASAWEEANPGETLYSGILEQLSWQQGLYSVDVYRGMNDGTITVDQNNVITVTPEAIARYGEDNLLFWHGDRGQLVRVPEGSNLWIQEQSAFEGDKPESMEQADWDKWMAEQNSGGYTLVGTAPEKKTGVLDFVDKQLEHTFHLGRDLRNVTMAATGAYFAPFTAGNSLAAAAPFLDENLGLDEAYFVTDPLGMTSGLAYGTEGFRRNQAGATSVLGDHGTQIQEIGRGVAGTIATVATGGLAGVGVAAAFAAANNINQAAGGAMDWGTAFANVAISTVSSRLMFDGGGIGAGFLNAANAGVASTLQSGIATGDWDAAVQEGAVAAVASGAVSGFNSAVSPQGAGMGALQGAAVSGGTTYLSNMALGRDTDEWALGQAFAQGAISGAATGARNQKTNKDWANYAAQTKVGPIQASAPASPVVGGWRGFSDWGTRFKPGNTVGGSRARRFGNWAWDKATPWATANERRQQDRAAVQSEVNSFVDRNLFLDELESFRAPAFSLRQQAAY